MRLAIDFGTTKVSVACLTKKGEPYVLNLDSGGLVPSGVFLQQDGSLLIGKAAERQAALNPINYLYSYKLRVGGHKPVLGTYTAADLVTEFLRYVHGRILNDAALRKESIEGVVLTCPVAFSPVQRELLIQAAKDAGFPEVELVSEPEAAGRAFCHYCAKSAFKERALVVDWGGGTFDVALVNRRTQFKVSDIRHTAGDNSMGGDLFDLYLTTYVLENLPDDVDSRLVPWFELTSRLRALKCRLSNHPTASFSMTVCSRHISVQITREEFEKLILKEVQKAADIVKQLLDSLHSNEQPEMLVLVGGTALIPSLRQELEKVVQLPVHTWMEARQAVVKGAALMCKEQAPMAHKGKSWLFYALLFAVYVALLLSGIVLDSDDALVWAFLWLGILPVLRLLYFRKLLRLIWFAPVMLVLSFVATGVFNGFVPALRTWYTELNFPLHEPSGLRIVKGYLDPEQVDILLQSGYPIDTAERGEPLLFWAARHGCAQGVELLCSKGAGVNIGVNGDTPLHVATLNNHAPCVEILVSYGADTKLCNATGKTAYDLARDLEMKEIASFLELYTDEGKARFLQEEMRQKNPSLCAFLEQRDLKQFRLSLLRGAPVNMARSKDGMTPLHLAVLTRQMEPVKALVSFTGIDVNKGDKYGNSPLHQVSKNGDLELLTLLLETNGIDVNKQNRNGETPLHISALNNHVESVKMLVSYAADIQICNETGKTAYDLARDLGMTEIAAFLEHYTDDGKFRFLQEESQQENPSLCASLEQGNLQQFRLYLHRGAPVNMARSKDGKAPLHLAVLHRQIEAVKALVSATGIDVNIKDKVGDTPLHHAAARGFMDELNLLLSHDDIDVNKPNNDGRTPLYYATWNKKTDVVKVLLSLHGIDVNKADANGNTPLHKAADNGDAEVVNLLLSAPRIDIGKVNNNGETPLHVAAGGDAYGVLEPHVDVLKKLLSTPGIDVNKGDNKGETPLHVAADGFHISALKTLLSTPRIDVNKGDNEGKTPLHIASQWGAGNETLVVLLSTHGIDVNKGDKNGETPLHKASFFGKTAALEALLSTSGIDVNKGDKDGETPLHEAMWRENSEALVKLLLAAPGIDVNKGDKYGETPLHEAMRRENSEALVKLLLAAPGIEVNKGDKDGETFLHEALKQENSEALVKLLLAAPGIDVNKGDKYGETPLHEALKQENSEALVKLLLAAPGIDVNKGDKDGETPLHEALKQENSEALVKLLLAIPGIDVNIANKEGNTPLHVAVSKRKLEVLKLLLSVPGINLDALNEDGDTPLQLADGEAAKLLREHGAEK